MPANAEHGARALPQLVGLGGRMRVHDQPDRRILSIGINQGTQHARRGRHPTRAGVVLGIGNNNRPLPRPVCSTDRIGNRGLGQKCLVLKRGLGGGIGVRDSIHRSIRRLLCVGIGHSRRAAIGDIRSREPHKQRRRERALRLYLCQPFIQSLCGRHIRGLERDWHQIGHAPERFGRPRAGLHHMIQQPRRCGTGICHVDMRIGSETCQHIHSIYKCLGYIAMQVQRGGNRHVRSH